MFEIVATCDWKIIETFFGMQMSPYGIKNGYEHKGGVAVMGLWARHEETVVQSMPVLRLAVLISQNDPTVPIYVKPTEHIAHII